MGIFNFIKKKSQIPDSSIPEKQNSSDIKTKEDFFKALFEQMAKQSPSQRFVQGTVFDIVRQQHSTFEQFVRAHDVMSVHKFLINSYLSFCNNPKDAGTFTPSAVNADNNDTDPLKWNTDIFDLQSGDVAALCFMPINDQIYEARIIGIVLGKNGDGYYYCNLNKNEGTCSDVMRNKAILGIAKTGEVTGRGFELMNAFLNCIINDYYAD